MTDNPRIRQESNFDDYQNRLETASSISTCSSSFVPLSNRPSDFQNLRVSERADLSRQSYSSDIGDSISVLSINTRSLYPKEQPPILTNFLRKANPANQQKVLQEKETKS
jgi:hypothetical protein